MYAILPLYLGRTPQPLKGEYYKQIVDIVEMYGLQEKIEPTHWETFKTDVNHYFKIFSQYKASVRTKDMKRYDRARVAIFQHLRQGLKMMRNSADAEIVEYYDLHVAPIVKLYNRYDVKKDGMSKTMEFRAFCRDVKKLKTRMLRRAYIYPEEVEKLLELCDLFEGAYVQRNNDRTQLEDIPALFDSIQDRWQWISAIFVVLANQDITDENRADVEAARTLINTVNESSAYFRDHYIRRTKKEEEEHESHELNE